MMNQWFLILVFASNVQIVPVQDRATCEHLKAEVSQQFGKGSSFQNAICTSVPGSGAPLPQPARK